jgi:uncharacterized protein
MSNPIVVFDTVIFVRALLNPHSRWGRLVFQAANHYRLIMSRYTSRELVSVLARPELRDKFPHIAEVDLATLVALIGQAELVNTGPVRRVSRDPKDDPLLALARAGGADYLVTEDRDLLDIHTYRGTQIITGAEFSRILQEEGGGGKAA